MLPPIDIPDERGEQSDGGNETRNFPIVGVGASAGGLEAFSELLRSLPPAPNMAFILIQHLDPHHQSLLAEICSRQTQLPVTQVVDGMSVERDHVYIIPPNTSLTIERNQLILRPRQNPDGAFMPIDIFFRSLAYDCGRLAVGVVLSGGGTDGALGLGEIKGSGGVTFVQNFESAKHDTMPRNAEGTGHADFVLPPAKIGLELVRLKSQGAFSTKVESGPSPIVDDAALPKIFQLLRQRTGADFSQYKEPTIQRRIARRMMLSGVGSLADYLGLLQERPEEQQALYEDFLIRVTSFFRDPAAFEILQSKVFPRFLKNRPVDNPIRIWVAGCATGEEVYSIAIVLAEVLGDMISNTPVKILATDLNQEALEKARAGSYIDNIALDVSADRLRRFFTKVNSHYQICKTIRDLCVFSRHNLAHDTPFANLDLISCRNVLIYLNPKLQKRVIPYFHYALRPAGCLMLGASETLGSSAQHFEEIDRDARVYMKRSHTAKIGIDFPVSDQLSLTKQERSVENSKDELGWQSVLQAIDRAVISRIGVRAIVVDEQFKVLQFRGNVGPFLNPATGTATLDLLRLVREGLGIELRAAIEAAGRENKPIRRERLQFRDSDQIRTINFEVIPILQAGPGPRICVILFEEASPANGSMPTSDDTANSASDDQTDLSNRIPQLERQLGATHDYLQSIIEANEAAQEELKAANEEVLSSNEELQSTNEELQTAKEELQSTNEELTTVNEELNHRNHELNQLNDDLVNLFGGLDIPVVMVTRDLRIRRYTPSAEMIFNLIATDLGRPISDLQPNLAITDLPKQIGKVIDAIRPIESEVQDHSGKWYSLRIRPYITTENKIDGATLALVDIDLLKRGLAEVKASRDNAETIVDTVWEPLVVLDEDLRVQRANAAFYREFQLPLKETEGRLFAELEGQPWNRPELLDKLRNIIPHNQRIQQWELEADFPKRGRRSVNINAHRIYWEGSGTRMILLAIEDVTNRKEDFEQAKLLAREQAARAEAETQNRMKDEFLAMLAHELRNPLAPIRNSFYILQQRFAGDPLVDQALEISNRQIGHMSRLLDDLLDIARITQRKISLRKELVNLQDAMSRAADTSQSLIASRNHQLTLTLPQEPVFLVADPARLEQILCNLLNNAAKYTEIGGHITLEAQRDSDSVTIRVIDDGIGIPNDLLPRVFDLFTQAQRSIDRSQGGLGIGLTLVRNLVGLHAGTVEAYSEGEGRGSTFIIKLPAVPNGDPAEITHFQVSVVARRILVVDDNRDAALTLAVLLRGLGHQVTIGYSAIEAIALADAEKPEVILLDIGLPKMSGYEVCRKMRHELKLSETLIVAVTGYGHDEDRSRSAEAGFDAHLVKPVGPEELQQTLERIRPPL